MKPKNLPRFGILATALALASVTPAARAQLPTAELHTIYPPVAAAGQTIEVSLTGLNLDDLTALQFSDPRIKGEPVMLPASEFRKYPVQDGTKFKVTIPAEVPEGTVEARAAGHFGISTSRAFTIVPKDTPIVADAGAAHFIRDTAPVLPVETIAYGRTDASQIDYWKFSAKKGQRLLIHCEAARIDSKADATLAVVNASGRELERNRDAIGRDPMVDFTAPADGEYWLAVNDFLFNGGADYGYRLMISEKPYIDAVFPPAGQQGQVVEVTLLGRNLPGGSPGDGLTIDGKPVETVTARITVPNETANPAFDWQRPSHAALPGFDYRHANANPVRLGFANAPQALEQGDAALAPVNPPSEIVARFDTQDDSDEFRFVAKKGTAYWVETIGDRLSGKIDPYLVVEKVTKGAENVETFAMVKDNDDVPGKGGSTFDTGTRDATVTFTADQDGPYRVTVKNQFGNGGPDCIYRLAIREARPDFSLLAVTERPYLDAKQAFGAAPLIRQGGTAPLRVLIDRRDGFAEPVTLKAEGLPAGVTSPPVTVAGNAAEGWLIFKGAPDAAPWAGAITVTGTSKIGETEVTRPVRSGGIVWGAADNTTIPTRARLDTTIPLAVSASEKSPAVIEAAAAAPLIVEMGQKLEIPVKVVSREGTKGDLTLTIEGLHGLVKSPTVNVADKAADGKLVLEFKATPNVFTPAPGTYSFAIKGVGTSTYQHNQPAADRAAEEQKLIEELAKKHTDAAAQAKTATDAAKKALDEATKKLAAVAADVDKAPAEKTVADAKSAFDAATKAAGEAEQKKVAAEKEKVAAAARTKAATDKAKAKDLKFAVYSPVITVEVKAAPEPAKK